MTPRHLPLLPLCTISLLIPYYTGPHEPLERHARTCVVCRSLLTLLRPGDWLARTMGRDCPADAALNAYTDYLSAPDAPPLSAETRRVGTHLARCGWCFDRLRQINRRRAEEAIPGLTEILASAERDLAVLASQR
ncbi:MAG: hypothetical protein HY369_01415 [Candidatus Aenigmarchaeota archaeon]|nr:hypothetical protein [Candidatus Aenigmarchaeota archaeon]